MRRKKNYKREHAPDIAYDSVAVSRFINYLMYDGKKSVAQKDLYGAFAVIEKTGKKPLEIFESALENVKPALEVVSRRVGGANYQVPREVRPERQFMLASKWIISAARSKKGRPISEKLAEELLAAAANEGTAIKKKQDIHRMAEGNRAFAHFAS
ncbi:MAG: 30S ribosomal protein S7 [Parcubacteria group bacterium]